MKVSEDNLSSCFILRAVLSSTVEASENFIRLLYAKRCFMHIVYLNDSDLGLEYLRSAWTQGKYTRDVYFVFDDNLHVFARDIILQDFVRLYFLTDHRTVSM